MAKNKEEYSEYIIMAIAGQSQTGGDPDPIANKILAGWHFEAATPGTSMHTGAVPLDSCRGRHRLRVWKTESGYRAHMILINTAGEEENLDGGKVISEYRPAEKSPTDITVEGNYLLNMVLECQPVSPFTAAAVKISLPTVTKPSAVPALLTLSKGDCKRAIESVFDKVCAEYGLEEADLTRRPKSEKDPIHLARSAICHLLQSYKIPGRIISKRMFPEKALTKSAYVSIYKFSGMARELIDSEHSFADMVTRLDREIRKEILMPSVSNKGLSRKKSGPPTPDINPEKIPQEPVLGVREMSVYVLSQMRVNPVRIASAFGLKEDEVYRMIGLVNVGMLHPDGLKTAQAINQCLVPELSVWK